MSSADMSLEEKAQLYGSAIPNLPQDIVHQARIHGEGTHGFYDAIAREMDRYFRAYGKLTPAERSSLPSDQRELFSVLRSKADSSDFKHNAVLAVAAALLLVPLYFL